MHAATRVRPAPGSSLARPLRELAPRARRAGYIDVADWANSECEGYRSDVPSYRHATGVPMGFNPMRGWVPIYVENRAILRAIGAHGLRQSIVHIEDAIATSANGKAHVHYTAAEIALVNAAAATRYAQMATCVDIRTLAAVITRVRALLDHWSEQLVSRFPPPPKGETRAAL